MIRHLILFLIHALAFAQPIKFTKVEISNVPIEGASIRSLFAEDTKVWYGNQNGSVGFYDFLTQMHRTRQVNFNGKFVDFRSVASNGKHIFALSAGSPALLYKIDKETLKATLVYHNSDPAIFFDGLAFVDEYRGVSFADPIQGRFQLLKTSDGGATWSLSAPEGLECSSGEAAFAASNSTLVASPQTIRIFTGGMQSNLYTSYDFGTTWSKAALPIVQGSSMKGVFTAEFYDEEIGFAAGGDYENPASDTSNKILTEDRGRQWKTVADGSGFGYASCVKFVPNSEGKELVVVGPSGIWYSSDKGMTWNKIHEDGNFYVIQFTSRSSAIAGGKGKVARLEFH